MDGSPHLNVWDLIAESEERSQLGRVLEGRLLHLELALTAANGSVAAEAQAVLYALVPRHALLTVTPVGQEPDRRSGADALLGDASLEGEPRDRLDKGSGRALSASKSTLRRAPRHR